MNKIVFCFPYRGVGGVSLLFLRIAEHLASMTQYEVYCIDYIDGFISKNVNTNKVHMLFYSDSIVVDVPEKSAIVFQTMTPWSIFPNIKIPMESKVFFWNCHPNNLIPTIPLINNFLQKHNAYRNFMLKTIFLTYWLKCNRFLGLMIENNAIAFMDSANKKNTESVFFPIEENGFLPIPALDGELKKYPNDKLMISDTINMSWIGRIVDFKYHILFFTLKKLNYISKNFSKKIIFTIIGDGDYLDKLKKETFSFKNIEFHYIENLSSKELNDFITTSTDLVFAMGTSALESAKFGIPTVLLDISYFPINFDYKFRFLYESDGATLGEVLRYNFILFDRTFLKKNDSDNLENLIIGLINDYQTISEKTRYYFHKNLCIIIFS